MSHNAKHSPVKVDGVIVGAASMDTTDKVGIIHMQFPTPEAAEKVWTMLNDEEVGYDFNDAAEPEDEFDHGDEMTFAQDLAQIINRHSRENVSGTPDFILATYLEACLNVFEITVQGRADFRGEQVEFSPTPSNWVGTTPNVRIIDEINLLSFGPSSTGLGWIESVDGKKPE